MASKFGFIVTLIATGGAAVAIAAAPAASAAAIVPPSPDDNTSIEQRPGHVAIAVSPPEVSDARSYGPFSSPESLLGE